MTSDFSLTSMENVSNGRWMNNNTRIWLHTSSRCMHDGQGVNSFAEILHSLCMVLMLKITYWKVSKRLLSRMILRNHTYLKVYKCWWILPILKTPTIKCLAIFFKKYFNFQGFYMVYIIIWRFLGCKTFTPSNWVKQGFKKCKMANLFLENNMEK